MSDTLQNSCGDRSLPRIAVSIGDPNGVGPEILLKCLAERSLSQICRLTVVGPGSVLEFYHDHLDLRADYSLEDRPAHSDFIPRPGIIEKEAGAVAMDAVERAVDMCLEGRVDAIVTCPISKEAIHLAGYDASGHTEFIARRVGANRHLMMMVTDELRVGLVSAHVPLEKVPRVVTRTAIREALEVMVEALKSDFGTEDPEIAVLGLNPHAGDGGTLGREDLDTILPEVVHSRARGVRIVGPVAADGFFGSGSWKRVDAVLAMYHDQGLIPFKTLSFGKGVNYTAGLCIVRTSPDHGTAFDIAGSGKASERSLRVAIERAVQIAERRKSAS